MGMIGVLQQVSPARIAQIRANPSLLDGRDAPQPGELDLEKMWHGLHYLLAASAGPVEGMPESGAILGGAPIGVDRGYGPRRLLEPDEVAAIAERLATISAQELRARFDPGRMLEGGIYPEIWDEGDEVLDELIERFRQVTDYYLDARRRGNGMLLWIS